MGLKLSIHEMKDYFETLEHYKLARLDIDDYGERRPTLVVYPVSEDEILRRYGKSVSQSTFCRNRP